MRHIVFDPTARNENGAAASASRVFKIGIAWQGKPAFTNDRQRSVPLAHFPPLAAVPGVRLLSLQKNHGTERLAEARKRFPILDFSLPLDRTCGAFLGVVLNRRRRYA